MTDILDGELGEVKRKTHPKKRLTRAQAQLIVEFMRNHPEITINEIALYLGRSYNSLISIRVTYGPRVGLPPKGKRPIINPGLEDRYWLEQVTAQLYAQVKTKKEDLLSALRQGKPITLKLTVNPPRALQVKLS